MKYYITTPIYYVNAKPHIAHAYTTLIADVLARYLRLKGKKVFFLTGTDEHGAKVAQKAQEFGKNPQEFCDQVAGQFEKAWLNLDITFDSFIRTTSELHKKGVVKMIKQLKENGDIYKADYEGFYCTGCEKFLTQKELIDGKCADHQVEPELIREKNYFFKLSKYTGVIKEKVKKDELLVRPQKRKNEIISLLDTNLEDFSISRESVEWGIDVPFDKTQKIYVWVEALMNYISALDYGKQGRQAGKFKKFWPADLHLIGKDITKFHIIYWPAILLSLKLPLPKQVFAHGYFTINGEKMSKTIGNVIDPNDLVEKWGKDATRYLILNQFPVGEDGDISLEKLEAQYKANLANDLGNLLQRVLVMMNKFEVKDKAFKIDPYKHQDLDFQKEFDFDLDGFLNFMDNLKIFKAIKKIDKYISQSNKYIEANKPWELAKTDKIQCQKVLITLYRRLILVARLIKPFMPDISKEMLNQLESGEPKPLFKK
ncbi:MAG: methionine--tRNA ligase [Candidatus Moranbacteria bacterium]|nr:methionine--tRNA ligase [Candidatus Moranbacteria bacterium]